MDWNLWQEKNAGKNDRPFRAAGVSISGSYKSYTISFFHTEERQIPF
jgi:hypothetical protein